MVAGILLSCSGVNVTGSSCVSCSPGGCRPPLRQRCRQLKSRLSLIPFLWAICATLASGKSVCWTSFHLNSGENRLRRVFSVFTGCITAGAEGYRPGKRAWISCVMEYSSESGQSVNTWRYRFTREKMAFYWRQSVQKSMDTIKPRQISGAGYAGSIPDYQPVLPFVCSS